MLTSWRVSESFQTVVLASRAMAKVPTGHHRAAVQIMLIAIDLLQHSRWFRVMLGTIFECEEYFDCVCLIFGVALLVSTDLALFLYVMKVTQATIKLACRAVRVRGT